MTHQPKLETLTISCSEISILSSNLASRSGGLPHSFPLNSLFLLTVGRNGNPDIYRSSPEDILNPQEQIYLLYPAAGDYTVSISNPSTTATNVAVVITCKG